MSHLERFLQEVTLRYGSESHPTALGEFLREMRLHLEDSRDAFVAQGMPKEEAELAAIRAFGDPRPAMPQEGTSLQTTARKLFDWRLRWETWAVCLGMLLASQSVPHPFTMNVVAFFVMTSLSVILVVGSGLAKGRVLMGPVAFLIALFLLVVVPTDGLTHPWRAGMPRSRQRMFDLEQKEQDRVSQLESNGEISMVLERVKNDPAEGAYSVQFNGATRYPKVILFGSPPLSGYTTLIQTRGPKLVDGVPQWQESDFFASEAEARSALLRLEAQFTRTRSGIEASFRDDVVKAERALYADPLGNFREGAGRSLADFVMFSIGLVLLQLFVVAGRMVGDLTKRRRPRRVVN